MAKYRGKYKKCRECKHAVDVMMVLVETKESCPKSIKFSSLRAVDKMTCEECEHFEKRRVSQLVKDYPEYSARPKKCIHKFVFLETSKNREQYTHGYCSNWVRTDRFYCEKCLETKEIKKQESCIDKPEWY